GPSGLPGAQVLRVGAAMRRHRPSGREPGGARLLSAAGLPHRELAPLHLPGAGGGAARDRGAAPSARARSRARLGARAAVPARPAGGRARSGARRAGRDLRLDQPRDRRLVRERADADLRRLFPEQADVFVAPPGGLSRLKVPAGVLAACRPDLSDLRLFDRRGREVPYVIDTGPEARTRVEVKETAEAAILDVQR